MAVPRPDRELARLRQLLADGLPPVLMLVGASDHFRAEAAAMVMAAVPADAQLRVVDAVEVRPASGGGDDEEEGEPVDEPATDAPPPPELLDLRGGGLFTRRNVVFVRRARHWWTNHAAAIAMAAKNIATGCSLVIEASKLDRRRRDAAALVKTVGEAGALFEFRDLWEQPFDRSQGPLRGELVDWLVGSAQKLGVPLRPDAAWAVVQSVGKSPAELLAELGRLRDRIPAAERRQPLAAAALAGLLTCSFESTPFELADALLDDDRRGALRAVHALFDRAVRNKDGRAVDVAGVMPFTASWLHRALANVYQGRLLADQGVPERDLPGRCGVHGFTDRFVAHVRRHDVSRLRRGLLALHHCQRLSRLSAEDPRTLLERFLAQWFDDAAVPAVEAFDL